MVQDENLIGMAVDEADGSGQLRVVDEDVVGEVEGAQLREAGIEVGAIHIGVGFGLQDVADAFESGIGRERREDCGDGGIDEGDPADDAGDPGIVPRRVRGAIRFRRMVWHACTEMTASMPAAEISGARSAGRKSRRIADMASSIQPYSSGV